MVKCWRVATVVALLLLPISTTFVLLLTTLQARTSLGSFEQLHRPISNTARPDSIIVSGGRCCYPQCSSSSKTLLYGRRRGCNNESKTKRAFEQRRNRGGEILEPKVPPPSRSQGAHPKSSQTIPVDFSFSTTSNLHDDKDDKVAEPLLIKVTAMQVEDPIWWDENKSLNPYGAKLWPSSLAIAQFLVTFLSNADDDSDIHVLELGCGAGLASIAAAAAQSGRATTTTVLATDISPIALSLAQQGWMATTRTKMKQQQQAPVDARDDTTTRFSTSLFDILSSQPLPLLPQTSSVDSPAAVNAQTSSSTALQQQQQQQNQRDHDHQDTIVIAGTIMYESSLAKALARRVVEAVVGRGAWVIVGDDDTGEREGGRTIFLEDMKRHKLSYVRTHQVVKHARVGWTEKHVTLLHFNAPPSVILQ